MFDLTNSCTKNSFTELCHIDLINLKICFRLLCEQQSCLVTCSLCLMDLPGMTLNCPIQGVSGHIGQKKETKVLPKFLLISFHLVTWNISCNRRRSDYISLIKTDTVFAYPMRRKAEKPLGIVSFYCSYAQ